MKKNLKNILDKMIKKIIMMVLLYFVLVVPSTYVYAKLSGNDCMSWYIEHYYPHGASYFINGYGYHIDGLELRNRSPSIHYIQDINGCWIPQGWYINIPYCYFVLLIEGGGRE